MALHQFVKGLSEKDQIELFNNAPCRQQDAFKSRIRVAMKQAEEFLNSVAEAIGEAVPRTSDAFYWPRRSTSLATYERTAVWGRPVGG